MTEKEIQKVVKGAHYHHAACFRGYVSRKIDGIVKPYKGRYGTGWKVYRPNWNSTNYAIVEYYINDEK